MKNTRKEWLSVLGAAKALGWSRHGVLAAALRGELKAQYIAGRIVISRDSLETLREKEAA